MFVLKVMVLAGDPESFRGLALALALAGGQALALALALASVSLIRGCLY